MNDFGMKDLACFRKFGRSHDLACRIRCTGSKKLMVWKVNFYRISLENDILVPDICLFKEKYFLSFDLKAQGICCRIIHFGFKHILLLSGFCGSLARNGIMNGNAVGMDDRIIVNLFDRILCIDF